LNLTDPFDFAVPASSANLGPGFGVIGLALDLTMRVRVEPRKKGTITVERHAGVVEQFDDPRHDPILRGVNAAAVRFQIKLPPALHVVVESDIPPACGLGTTSASYACGLAVATRFARDPIPFEAMVAELVELGGDPAHGAASLVGGLVTCSQVGDAQGRPRYRVFPHEVLDAWRFVVVCPAVQLGVAELARLLPPSLPHAAAARTSGRVVGILRALATGDEDLLSQCIGDEVHVPYRKHAAPGMGEGMEAARAAGAAAATISGAGPALIAMTTDAARCEAIGAAMAEAFARNRVGARTLVLRTSAPGALVQVPG
jgi:homoserine kinase